MHFMIWLYLIKHIKTNFVALVKYSKNYKQQLPHSIFIYEWFRGKIILQRVGPHVVFDYLFKRRSISFGNQIGVLISTCIYQGPHISQFSLVLKFELWFSVFVLIRFIFFFVIKWNNLRTVTTTGIYITECCAVIRCKQKLELS